WSVANRTENFWLALPAGALVALVIGVVIERGFLNRVLGDELMQVCLTLGVAYIVADITRWIWGGDPLRVRAPEVLRGSTRLFGSVFPTYRLALIVVGVVLAVI